MAEFIVIEGLDGTGKTTQISLLADELRKRGIAVETTAEPTALPTGRLLRRVLSGEVKSSPWSTAALFLSDRIQHNVGENGIRDMLEQGKTVISDRYYYSTFAYQGSDTDVTWTMDMHFSCPEIRKPDLVIFLTADVDVCLDRIRSNRPDDTIEIYENTESLSKTKAKFEQIFDMLEDRENIISVDAAGTVEEVHNAIMAVYDSTFKSGERQ